MIATLKYATISEKKLELIAKLVRGRNYEDAVTYLSHLPHKGARILLKVLKSAAANAKHDAGHLFISTVDIGKGPKIKRMLPVSRGRGHPYVKYRSFVSVKLSHY